MGAKCECRDYEETTFPIINITQKKASYGCQETTNSTVQSNSTCINKLQLPIMDSSGK